MPQSTEHGGDSAGITARNDFHATVDEKADVLPMEVLKAADLAAHLLAAIGSVLPCNHAWRDAAVEVEIYDVDASHVTADASIGQH
jgi:hypothetical protein